MTAILEPPVRPETGDDRLYEVVYGQLKEKITGTRQNLIACRIACLIGQFDAGRQLGHPAIENLFVLDAASELQRRPDFSFVARQQWSGLPPDANAWDVVPDWMVEIISPSNSADEVIEKVDEYFHAGTRLVWVIYPNSQRVYVYTSPTDVTIYEASDELTAEPVLPAFRLQTDALFEGIAVSAPAKP